MKKVYKALTVLCVLLFVIGIVSPVLGIEAKKPTGGTAIGQVTKVTGNLWSTVQTVVQVLAIAAIVFAGVRYMFASADQKADIKKQTVILIVGAVLVFAAVPLAQFISKAGAGIFAGATS